VRSWGTISLASGKTKSKVPVEYFTEHQGRLHALRLHTGAPAQLPA